MIAAVLNSPFNFAAGGGGGDTDYSYRSLILNMNGTNGSTTVVDNSANAFSVTCQGNAQLSTADPKFGTAALALDGSGDGIYVSDNAALDFGTGDFSIEFWIKWSSTSGYQIMYDHGYIAGIALETGNGTGRFTLYMGGVSVCAESSSIGTGVWGFYQIVRSGTAVTIYRDGVSTASGTSSANIAPAATLYLGSYSSGAFGINGLIGGMRLTKGIPGTIEVPTADFPTSA